MEILNELIGHLPADLKSQAITKAKAYGLAKLQGLDKEALKAKALEAINKQIDEVDIPKAPDAIIDPICKKIVAAYVPKLIDELYAEIEEKLQ
jgi:uncharacterized protein YfeS